MKSNEFADFSRWSPGQLQRAEIAAGAFLKGNISQIAHDFEKRLGLIRQVSDRMRMKNVSFEERVICLSMIEELSKGMEQTAHDLFELAVQPSVANMVHDLQ